MTETTRDVEGQAVAWLVEDTEGLLDTFVSRDAGQVAQMQERPDMSLRVTPLVPAAEIRRLRSELENEIASGAGWQQAYEEAEAELERRDAALRFRDFTAGWAAALDTKDSLLEAWEAYEADTEEARDEKRN